MDTFSDPPLSAKEYVASLFRCTICHLPIFTKGGRGAERCTCIPDAFTCSECHRAFPFRLSRFHKRKHKRVPEDEWARGSVRVVRKYVCPKCRENAAQRSNYKLMKVEAGKQIYAERKRMNAHPLYKWAKHARAYAAVLRCQLPDKRLSHRPYYELLVRALFDYAERIEAALAANPNLDYAREGKGGYPDELKPSSKLIYERLPRIERGQLYEMASHLGLKRHRTVWGEINRRNP